MKRIGFIIVAMSLVSGALTVTGCAKQAKEKQGKVLTTVEREAAQKSLAISPVAAFPGENGNLRFYGEITNNGDKAFRRIGFTIVEQEGKDVITGELLDLKPKKTKSFDIQTQKKAEDARGFIVRVDFMEVER